MCRTAIAVLSLVFAPLGGCITSGELDQGDSSAAGGVRVAVEHGDATSLFRDGLAITVKRWLAFTGEGEIGILLPPSIDLLDGEQIEMVDATQEQRFVVRNYFVRASGPGTHTISAYASEGNLSLGGISQGEYTFTISGDSERATIVRSAPPSALLQMSAEARGDERDELVVALASDTSMRARVALNLPASIVVENGSREWIGAIVGGERLELTFDLAFDGSLGPIYSYPLQISAKGDPRYGSPMVEIREPVGART